jgi:hypothetical protein
MSQKKHKWTAIFLIKGAADNIRELNQLLDQLTSVEETEDIAVVLCINIKAEIAPDILPITRVLGPGDVSMKEPGWTTLFCSLERNPKGGCIFQYIHESRDFRIDKEQDITGFFKEKVLSSFIAEKYILFTWDHGQPFGIFPGINRAARTPTENLNLKTFHFRQQKQLNLERQTHRMAVPTEEDDVLPILTITELKQAIQWAFDGQKIDVLVMANCFLHFFDTGYELSDTVDYLVTFETVMFFKDTFNYKVILEDIGNDPDILPEALSKNIVNLFASETNTAIPASRDEVALFANDLSWYAALGRMIDKLAEILTKALPTHREKILIAANKCDYISPGIPMFCLLDFRNLITHLYEEMPDVFTDSLFNTFKTLLDNVVIESFIGKDFDDDGTSAAIKPSGFSIYFPRLQEDYKTSFLDNFMTESSLSPTEFTKRFGWDMFIRHYILTEPVEEESETGEEEVVALS